MSHFIRVLFSCGVALVLVLLPVPVAAQESRAFFGPIIPQNGPCTCPESAPDFGCALDVFQNVLNVAVSLIVVAMTLWIAYAGLRMILAGGKPDVLLEARQRLYNAVIGLVVALGAWLIVDFVMKVLYDPSTTLDGGNFGPWQEIWAGNADKMCIRPNLEAGRNIISGSLAVITGAPGTSRPGVGSAAGGGTGTPGSVSGPGACNWETVKAAGIQAGAGTTDQQAKYLACIARPESGCGSRIQNYNWGRGSSAYGPFQVLLSTHADCYETRACQAAGGGSGPLNCAAGFTNGNVSNPTIANRCTRAAANLGCSVAAAQCVLRKQGPTAWSGNADSKPAHQACAQYLR